MPEEGGVFTFLKSKAPKFISCPLFIYCAGFVSFLDFLFGDGHLCVDRMCCAS